MLIGNQVPFDLPLALAQAAPLQPIAISQQHIQQVIDFVLRRLEQVLVDGGTSVEAVRAVLRQRGNSPALAAESAQQLQVRLRMLLGSVVQSNLISLKPIHCFLRQMCIRDAFFIGLNYVLPHIWRSRLPLMACFLPLCFSC